VSDVQGIILHNILKDPAASIEIWPKLKVYFFNAEYSQIYAVISKYYNKYNKLPSFEELKITTREETLVHKVRALELLSVSEDIDNDIAVEALTDQYTQDTTLESLIIFLDNLPHYDTEEIKLQIAEILQRLEEQTNDAEDIVLMSDVFVIDKEEVHNKVPLGLNNELDAKTGGMALSELIMLGGPRGSGKTVLACNATTNQYTHGNVGLFFSIEMRHREIFNRFISILANVDNTRLRRMACTPEELNRIADVRTNMFVDSEEVYQDYLGHKDYEKFEIDLIRSKKLKPDNQLVIIDNQNLTLADIDMNIQKFKNQFGDKLKVVTVDYVNQIDIPDVYAWKTQIWLSKKLKSFARKYDIVMVTPYQTDKTGEARLSKGILDAADVATNLTAESEFITVTSTKTRNIAPFEFNAPIDWNTFAMSPQDAVIAESEEETKEKPGDVPWT
jgi:replicative DNA helicase